MTWVAAHLRHNDPSSMKRHLQPFKTKNLLFQNIALLGRKSKTLNLYTTKTKQSSFYYNHNMLNICFYGIKGHNGVPYVTSPFPDEKYEVTVFGLYPCVFVTWVAAHLRHNDCSSMKRHLQPFKTPEYCFSGAKKQSTLIPIFQKNQ